VCHSNCGSHRYSVVTVVQKGYDYDANLVFGSNLTLPTIVVFFFTFFQAYVLRSGVSVRLGIG